MNPTLLAILTFLKPYAWYLALGLVSLVLSHKSQIDDWAEKYPRYAAVLKFVRALGLDPWLLLQSLTLLIKGRLPDNVAAGSKTSTRVPPGLSLMIFVWLAFGAVVSLTSCSSPPPKDPAAIGAQARKEAQLSYAVAVVTLTALDDIHATWLNAIPQPTEEQLAASTKIAGALKGVRDGLETARPWIQDGTGDESAARTAVTQSLDAASTAAEIMGELGARVPDVVFDALNAARAALGGGK